jgi:hypothetical protein
MQHFTMKVRTDMRMLVAIFVMLHVLKTTTQILGEPQNLSGMINRVIVKREIDTRQFSA